MREKESLSDYDIIQCLSTKYGIEGACLNVLSIGADVNAFLYKVQTLDSGCYFVKLKRNCNHNGSLAVLRLLDEAGIQEIILPVETTQGKQSLSVGAFTMIVYPFIEGKDGFSQDLTKDQWIVLGKTLKRIHEIEVPLDIQKQIRRETLFRCVEKGC